MKVRTVLLWCATAIVVSAATPALAGQWDLGPPGQMSYWETRDAIYARVNLIAHLEADPEIDEGFKGPIITVARHEIHYLRSTIGPPPRPWQPWPTPCCYARKPLHIR